MLRFAICDDQREILILLKDMLEQVLSPMKHDIVVFTDADTFLKHIRENETDIALVDINLTDIRVGFSEVPISVSEDLSKDTGTHKSRKEGVNGIVVAKQINELSPQTAVIFVSGQQEFDEQLYEAEHQFFLKKPVTPERLLAAVQKAARKVQSDTIAIAYKGSVQNIRTDNIVMVESYGRNLKIYTADGGVVFHIGKLSEFCEQLGNAEFLRCHQSYLVNNGHIAYIDNREIRLAGGITAPISRRYAPLVKRTLLRKQGGLL